MFTHPFFSWSRTGQVATALLALQLAQPRAVHACGGFFCSNVPVAQSGENVVFDVGTDGAVTTHVQITYTGPAREFAWILPLKKAPDAIGVGTDALFSELETRSRPRFDRTYEQRGDCRETPRCRDPRYGAGGHYFDAAAASRDAGEGHGVEVISSGNVGPYETVVLSSDDADSLFTWLRGNEFLIPEAARPEIAQYVSEHAVFVALKLQKDRDAGEIQPIVLRFDHDGEACIPLRLTKIAATENMPVRAYFLASQPARAMGFGMTEVDLDDAGLWLGTRSYESAVASAVDDAGGRAFVVDYAGATPSGSPVALRAVDDLATEHDVARFFDQLLYRGYTRDTQLLGVLQRVFPPPPGMDARAFYNCAAQSGCLDSHPGVAERFDPAATASAIEHAITQPRRDADALLGRQPKLTRLFTVISPDEMTADPWFALDPAGRSVPNVHVAHEVTQCSADYFDWSAPATLTLPSGRIVPLRAGIAYHGTDTDYCADREAGSFVPWAPEAVLRATAARREREHESEGGLCSVSTTRIHRDSRRRTPETFGNGLAALVTLAVCARRRAKRKPR